MNENVRREAGLPFAAGRDSLSAFGSEILVATWEARAAQCDQTADQFEAVTKNFACSYREKARAYRKCVEDLRRQMGHEIKRQPDQTP